MKQVRGTLRDLALLLLMGVVITLAGVGAIYLIVDVLLSGGPINK